MSVIPSRFAPFCLLAAMLPAFPVLADTAPHEDALKLKRHIVIDSQGWGQSIEAAAALVPTDWKTRSMVHWTRKCSADMLYDTRFVTQSPDGRRGLQIFPGLRFDYFDNRYDPSAFAAMIPSVPGIPGMPSEHDIMQAHMDMVERREQERIAALKHAYRGTDCHWSQAIGARDIVERYVIPRRAPGGTIVSEERVEEIEKAFTAELSKIQRVAGSRFGVEAKQFRVRFLNGSVPTEAAMLVVVTASTFDTNSGTGLLSTVHDTKTLPIVTSWAPVGEIDATAPIISAIQQSWRFNPRWLAATAKVRANINRINREGARRRHQIWMQTQREISQMQMESWQTRQEANDAAHQRFTDYIHEVARYEDPNTGDAVGMPLHYDQYFVSDDGEYLALGAGVDPAELFPDQVWTEMLPAVNSR
ncbi:MAG: hypothetical protein AAGF59_15870 [Pseudomonadota bacterium]